MTDWKPLMGTVPPLTEEAWQEAFAKYKAFPEYQLKRPDMTLAEFKAIFFWEYLHRLLARFSGLAFLVPYLWFLARRAFRRGLALKLGFAFLLGGAQGLMGWYMVKSGLADNPFVSHFRLAAHLGLALTLFAYLFWLALDVAAPPDRPRGGTRPFRMAAMGFVSVLCLQIAYGAFTAGLDAGYAYNTFPLMMGRWVPPGAAALDPFWSNLVSNPATVQFVHRSLGWVLAFAVAGLWWWSCILDLPPRARLAVRLAAALTVLQFGLGIATLLLMVPVVLGVLHQVVACLLLAAGVLLLHSLRGR
jgi:cytochrome c oxidase assembly protein subunit 15